MSEDEAEVKHLKDQQLAQEQAALEALKQAETEAEADKQLRGLTRALD